MKKQIKIAIASGKGGVGKSMLASSLSILFARSRQLVAVDADVDAPNLHLWLGGIEQWDKVFKISSSQKAQINNPTFEGVDACVEKCPFRALFVKKGQLKVNPYFCEGCGFCEEVCPQAKIRMVKRENAVIKIKNKTIFGFPLVSAELFPGEEGSGKIVSELLNQAEDFSYEVMIIDSSAGVGCPVNAALRSADFAVVVVEPTVSGISDLRRVLKIVRHFRLDFAVVINKWDINKQKTKAIERSFPGKILGKITYNQEVLKAVARLKPIMTTELGVKSELREVFDNLKRFLG